MEPPDRVAAVILAAGEARRFGSPKQLAELKGRTLLQRVIDAACGARLVPIIAVIPPDLPLNEADVLPVTNARPELGMSHSLRLGFGALPDGVNAAVILLGDQPTVHAALIERLLAARGSSPFVATSAAGGPLMPPVLVECSHFNVVTHPTGDIGLRDVLRTHRALVTAVELSEPLPDVDTEADLEAIGGG